MAEGFGGGFGDWFNTMNPQGNPLELASMLAHDPEGIIPALVQENISPQMFEERAFGGAGGLGGMSSGQLLNTAGNYGIPVTSGPQQAAMPALASVPAPGTLTPTPVQTLSIPRPVAAAAPAPAAAAVPDEVAAASPAPGATAPTTAANPATDISSRGKTEEDKKLADLVKLLAGVKMPAPPVVQLPRPGTAGPPAVRPINPQSAISALLQQALGGGRAAPSLSSLVRR